MTKPARLPVTEQPTAPGLAVLRTPLQVLAFEEWALAGGACRDEFVLAAPRQRLTVLRDSAGYIADWQWQELEELEGWTAAGTVVQRRTVILGYYSLVNLRIARALAPESVVFVDDGLATLWLADLLSLRLMASFGQYRWGSLRFFKELLLLGRRADLELFTFLDLARTAVPRRVTVRRHDFGHLRGGMESVERRRSEAWFIGQPFVRFGWMASDDYRLALARAREGLERKAAATGASGGLVAVYLPHPGEDEATAELARSEGYRLDGGDAPALERRWLVGEKPMGGVHSILSTALVTAGLWNLPATALVLPDAAFRNAALRRRARRAYRHLRRYPHLELCRI